MSGGTILIITTVVLRIFKNLQLQNWGQQRCNLYNQVYCSNEYKNLENTPIYLYLLGLNMITNTHYTRTTSVKAFQIFKLVLDNNNQFKTSVISPYTTFTNAVKDAILFALACDLIIEEN